MSSRNVKEETDFAILTNEITKDRFLKGLPVRVLFTGLKKRFFGLFEQHYTIEIK